MYFFSFIIYFRWSLISPSHQRALIVCNTKVKIILSSLPNIISYYSKVIIMFISFLMSHPFLFHFCSCSSLLSEMLFPFCTFYSNPSRLTRDKLLPAHKHPVIPTAVSCDITIEYSLTRKLIRSFKLWKNLWHGPFLFHQAS